MHRVIDEGEAVIAKRLDAETIVQDVQAAAADLRGLLARHVAQARQEVRLLLDGRLVYQPFDDGAEKGYAFTATGTYRRLGCSWWSLSTSVVAPTGRDRTCRIQVHDFIAR